MRALAWSAASLGLMATSASASEVTVHASGAIAVALKSIQDDYQRSTGDRLAVTVDRSADIERKVGAGRSSDVVIAESKVIDRLVAAQKALPGSVATIARSPICVVVPKGRPVPAIGTPAELKKALLTSRSVGYSNSLSGAYVTTTMFPRLGIDRQMKLVARQVPVAAATVRGHVDIAFSQCSEMLHVAGLTVVGRLPEKLQHYSVLNGFIGAGTRDRAAAARLLAHLGSAAAARAIQRTGLIPAREK